MYLRINELEIENKHLNNVLWDVDYRLLFSGVALDDEGQTICNRLSKFQNGQIVEVEVETKNYGRFEGICEIVEIKTQPPKETDKALAIFRFEGILKQIF